MPGPREVNFVGARALMRGDTWPFQDVAVVFTLGRTLLTPGVVLRSTVKRSLEMDDPAHPDPLVDASIGAMQVDSDARGGITVLGATSLRAVFPAEQTELLPLAKYFYDIVIDFGAIESYTLFFGVIDCVADVTRTRP